MGELQITQQMQGDALVLQMSGSIDEDTVFPQLQQASPKVVMDLENVKSINSCGIREWVKWVTPISSGSQIFFQRCPKVIVDQMNMVEGFLPQNAIVDSFYVPYFCDDNDLDKIVLVQRGNEFQHTGQGGEVINIPETINEEGNEYEIDVIESKYFKFLGA